MELAVCSCVAGVGAGGIGIGAGVGVGVGAGVGIGADSYEGSVADPTSIGLTLRLDATACNPWEAIFSTTLLVSFASAAGVASLVITSSTSCVVILAVTIMLPAVRLTSTFCLSTPASAAMPS